MANSKPKPLPAPSPESEFQKLMASAFADSMMTLMGRPRVVALQPHPTDDEVMGEYKPGADSISLSPSMFYAPTPGHDYRTPVGQTPSRMPDPDGFAPEYTLSHELAHRMMTQMILRDRFQDRHLADLNRTIVAKDDSIRNSGGTVPGYAGRNDDEGVAQAMANAVQFLRTTASARAHPGYQQESAPLLNVYERAVPGTAPAVNYLLQQPLYAGHPLNVSQELHYPQPDATAVARPVARQPVLRSRLPIDLK